MTNQEKEALLKRIYSLPTEWADGGGSYGKGGPVGSEDAAMLWPEDVIDAISQFAEDNNAPVKQPDHITGLDTDTNVARKDPVTSLVPCGCGGKAEYYYHPIEDWAAVECVECGADTSYKDTKEQARDAWNRAMGYKGEV